MRRLNMLVNETYEGRNINSVTESQKKEIKEYLERLVKIWCLTTPEKSFTCSELLNNADWEKKPLCQMYDYYKKQGESDEEAKRKDSGDVGWLLLEVISEKPRKFEAESNYRKTYTYIPEQSFIDRIENSDGFFQIKNKKQNAKLQNDSG